MFKGAFITLIIASAVCCGNSFIASAAPAADSVARKTSKAPQIVVTGLRAERDAETAPVPTTIISAEALRAQASVRLQEALGEQPGLNLVPFLGLGVQMQGLDPAYTLILLDGEPLVGRQSGTLNLTRVALGNVSRIEIVKGPSSSLYGSDALGGVINIITRQPEAGIGATANARYGSFNSLDLNAAVETRANDLAFTLFANRNSSDGYALVPSLGEPTVAPYVNYTIHPKFTWDIAQHTRLKLSARLNAEDQNGRFGVTENGVKLFVADVSALRDWNATGIFETRYGGVKHKTTLYLTRYEKTSDRIYAESGAFYAKESFKQSYLKLEEQADITLSAANILMLGAGAVRESVEADRVMGGQRSTFAWYAFAQDEWNPQRNVALTASARFDSHSDYGSYLSPKLAASWRFAEKFSARASVGSGFKAATLQQIYMYYSNSIVGYSVFGATVVQEGIQKLIEQKQVSNAFASIGNTTLQPEVSVAFNASLAWRPVEEASLTVSAFRNSLTNLIEWTPIADKIAGGQVFTYHNINDAFTQGVEGEAQWSPIEGVAFSAGYQYLETADKKALQAVHDGKIFKIGKNGNARPVQEVEYGGLLNRSKHSGTIKTSFSPPESGFTATARCVWRGRFGVTDLNGNGILDDDLEYAEGYALINFSIAQRLTEWCTLTVGVENTGNYTNVQYLPMLPGRTIFVNVGLKY